MRPGWNPTRRNRNIGTPKQGHGQDNRLVIPTSSADPRPFWEKLTSFRVVTRPVNGRPFSVAVETTRPDSVHACTVDDLFRILPHIPAEDLDRVRMVVLRQPKRKEQTLRSCWGRLAYAAKVGDYWDPTVILEAREVGVPLRWSVRLNPDFATELERLREDGHRVVSTGRRHVIEWSLEATRATQLYRTLPHEVGHWVDYLRCVTRPAAEEPYSWEQRWERHMEEKPAAEREAFAHQYADRLRAKLLAAGLLPFERILDEASIRRDGLNLSDFVE